MLKLFSSQYEYTVKFGKNVWFLVPLSLAKYQK